MDIGIIGAGISGLTAAWFLSDQNVTVFEKANRLGGHAYTVNVPQGNQTIPVDAGAQFFYDEIHPLFKRLLAILGVGTFNYDTDVTFRNNLINQTNFIYSNPWAHPTYVLMNLFNFLNLQNFLSVGADTYVANQWNLTTVDLINMLEVPQSFKDNYALPFIACAWTEGAYINNTAAIAPLYFMAYGHPKQTLRSRGPGMWAVTGGTQAYVQALAQKVGMDKIKYPVDIQSIAKQGDKWILETNSGTFQFDQLIIGTQALQATSLMQMISSTTPQFQPLYNLFQSLDPDNPTTVDVHSDTRLMPVTDRSQWNLINLYWNGEQDNYNSIWEGQIYNKVDVFKTWTTHSAVKPATDKVFQSVPFNHFYHTPNNFYAQTQLASYQGVGNLWFVGAWTIGIDSHEGGIKAAMRVAQRLGASQNLYTLANRLQPIT